MAEFGQDSNRRPNRRDRQDPGEEKQFDERVVHIDRVARVVKGGRRFRFRALVVVGDHKGKVGIGISKGADVTAAVTKAVEVAKKHFVQVVIANGTIPHEAEVKVGGAKILVKPAAPGTGLIAGGVVRTVVEVAGITNILSKSLGSANKINTAYATLRALQSVKDPKTWLTKQKSNVSPEAKSKPKAAKTPSATKKADATKAEVKV
jgi:small subunit ribosomal protein S5